MRRRHIALLLALPINGQIIIATKKKIHTIVTITEFSNHLHEVSFPGPGGITFSNEGLKEGKELGEFKKICFVGACDFMLGGGLFVGLLEGEFEGKNSSTGDFDGVIVVLCDGTLSYVGVLDGKVLGLLVALGSIDGGIDGGIDGDFIIVSVQIRMSFVRWIALKRRVFLMGG